MNMTYDEIIYANCSNKKSVLDKKSSVATTSSMVTTTSTSPSLASKAKPKVIPPRPRGLYKEMLIYFYYFWMMFSIFIV